MIAIESEYRELPFTLPYSLTIAVLRVPKSMSVADVDFLISVIQGCRNALAGIELGQPSDSVANYPECVPTPKSITKAEEDCVFASKEVPTPKSITKAEEDCVFASKEEEDYVFGYTDAVVGIQPYSTDTDDYLLGHKAFGIILDAGLFFPDGEIMANGTVKQKHDAIQQAVRNSLSF